MGSLFRSATLWWQRGPLIQLWDDCANIEQVYQAVLAESGVPESELGLSAYVSLRGYGCRVESPAFSLMEALVVRWRLQRARDTSWDSFRRGRSGFASCARGGSTCPLQTQLASQTALGGPRWSGRCSVRCAALSRL